MASDRIEQAALLALRAHDGQMRKEGNTPYIIHPFMVALTLTRYGFPESVVAAALTHDVLEDTDVGEDELRAAIGDEALAIVKSVTNDDTLPWEEKKQKYIDTVRASSEDAKAVATADKIHNAQSLISAHERQGKDVWKFFNAGKEKKLWFEEAMLQMLQETWKHPLVTEYAELVEKLKALD